MICLGAHLSSSRGFYKMGQTALSIGANTFQCFVRNPRGARAKAVDPSDLGRLRELMAEHGFGPVIAHAPYIMNPCSKDEGIRALAAEMMAGDLALMETGRLKLSYLEGESSLINGDLIVTSGLGGYYPSQLVIGSVEEIRTDDNGLTRYAVLAPKTDLDSLSEVFVITSFDTVD